jgi:hypothetical protein
MAHHAWKIHEKTYPNCLDWFKQHSRSLMNIQEALKKHSEVAQNCSANLQREFKLLEIYFIKPSLSRSVLVKMFQNHISNLKKVGNAKL